MDKSLGDEVLARIQGHLDDDAHYPTVSSRVYTSDVTILLAEVQRLRDETRTLRDALASQMAENCDLKRRLSTTRKDAPR